MGAQKAKLLIKSFPEDEQTYIVRRYGLIRKNTSAHATGFMAEITLMDIDTKIERTVEVMIAHPIIIKIGSVWKNQRLVSEFSPIVQQKNLEVFEKHNFSIRTDSCWIEYLIKSKATGKKEIRLKKDYDKSKEDILSVFTVFLVNNETTIAIPSLEIFVSTYTPQTYSILYALMTKSIESVIHEHVANYYIEREGEQEVYYIEPIKNHYMSTRLFLSYLACNKTTQKNVSAIRSSLENNANNTLKVSAMEVFPFHPGKYDIVASGVYDHSKKRYWIYQIHEYNMPAEAIYTMSETEDDEDQKRFNDKDPRYRINTDKIEDDEIELTDLYDSGGTAGIRYIHTPVKMKVCNEKIKKVTNTKKTQNAATTRSEKTKAENVSASPLSGAKESENTGTIRFETSSQTDSKGEDDVPTDEVLVNILNKRQEDISYIDNKWVRHEALVYCETRFTKTKRGRKRRLVICEIPTETGVVYVLDIKRDASDKYAGLIFKKDTPINDNEFDLLLDGIVEHKGRFSNMIEEQQKNDKVSDIDFISSGIIFRHKTDEESMAEYINEIIDDYV